MEVGIVLAVSIQSLVSFPEFGMAQALCNYQSMSCHEGVARPISRNDLIREYVPVIRRVASKMAGRLPHFVEMGDLLGAGVVGLIDAIDKFDPSRSIDFQAYAAIRIRGAILDELRSLDWVPRSIRRKLALLKKNRNALTRRLTRRPTKDEEAAALGMDIRQYQALVDISQPPRVVSLEGLGLRTDPERRDFLCYLQRGHVEDPVSRLYFNRVQRILTDAIEELDERLRVVLSLYYFEDLNLKEIGLILGVSESRVSQIHGRALRKLRSSLSQICKEPQPGPAPS